MVTRACFAFVVTLLLPLLLASPGQAILIEINSRGALGGNDFIDWGTLGPSGTVLGHSFPATSNGGIGAAVSQPPAFFPFERIDEGPWGGNFAPGDALIWNGTDTISIAFNTPVAGVGTQLQTFFFGPFTATLQAFDSGNNLLGSFTQDGISTAAGDNSAIFLGILNDIANIDHITFIVTNGADGFAMNQLDLVTVNAVPEPTGFLLFGAIATGLGLARWRRGGEQHDHA